MPNSKKNPEDSNQDKFPETITIIDPNGTPVQVPDGFIVLLKPDGTHVLVEFP